MHADNYFSFYWNAGWLAGKIMKGKGYGLAGNLIIGVIGALLDGFLFRLLGISKAGFSFDLLLWLSLEL